MTRSARGRGVTDQERPRRRREPEAHSEASDEVEDLDGDPGHGELDDSRLDDVEDVDDAELDDEEPDDVEEPDDAELDVDEPDDDEEPDEPEPPPRKPPPARKVARWAAEQVMEMSGKESESVTSVHRTDDGWVVELEVVESRRVPDSTDVLASYEAEMDDEGELLAYRRLQRYTRGRGNG